MFRFQIFSRIEPAEYRTHKSIKLKNYRKYAIHEQTQNICQKKPKPFLHTKKENIQMLSTMQDKLNTS